MNFNNKNQIAGIILAGLMLIALLNSAYYFLAVLKLNIGQWLTFNACSLVIIIYLICFVVSLLKKDAIWLSIALLPMYYYGTMGLFLMPWNDANLFAHLTHIIITCNALWILFRIFKEHRIKELGVTLLISIIAFVPVFAIIQNYNQAHMEEFMQVFTEYVG